MYKCCGQNFTFCNTEGIISRLPTTANANFCLLCTDFPLENRSSVHTLFLQAGCFAALAGTRN